MAIVVKPLKASDQLNEIIEKINFNFNQTKLNGGGPIGLPGKDSSVKGIPGIRGNIWHYGNGDPNLQVFGDLLDNDLYLEDSGVVWECTDHINQTWVLSGFSVKGETGETGADGLGIFAISDNGTDQHFFYTPPVDIGTGSTNVRSFVFGGYPESGGHAIDSSIYENLNASDAIVYLYTPSAGLPQLKFLHESTEYVNLAPTIYSISSDVLFIENKRAVTQQASLLDGIKIQTDDTNIVLNSKRNIDIVADGRFQITTEQTSSIGNLNLISYDLESNQHADPSLLNIENSLFGTTKKAFIQLKADSKTSSRYIYMGSDYDGSYLKIDTNIELTTNYFSVNSTQGISAISNDFTLANNSSRYLVTELAIKTYIDTVASGLTSDIDYHIADTGASHTYIDQSVTTTATPKFARIYIDGTTNYIDTTSSFLTFKSGGNEILIGGSTSEMSINSREPAGGSPSKFIFNNGSNSSYSSLEGNHLIAHGQIEMTNGGWLTTGVGSDEGIYINTSNKIRFSDIGTSGVNRIAMFDIGGYFYAQIPNTAFNLNFGTGINNIIEIGAVLANDLVTGTDSTGKLITLSAAIVRDRIGLANDNVSTHYHDSRYIRRDVDCTFLGKLSVGNTSNRSAGLYGFNDDTKISHIWSIGTSYKILDSGDSFGTLYGMAYQYTDVTTMAGNHQIAFVNNGTPNVTISTRGNIWLTGQIISIENDSAPFIVASTTKVINLNADKLDDLDSTQLARTDVSTETFDGGVNTHLIVKSNDNGESILSLYGDDLGTGRLFVGQNEMSGGGIEYNGDNSPASTGAGASHITLFRRNEGTNYWTAKNYKNNNDWVFRGSVYSEELYEDGTSLINKYLGITSKAADSDLIDGLDSTQFIRSDIDDTVNGDIRFTAATGWEFSGSYNGVRISQPSGGYYTFASGVIVGAIEIVLPQLKSSTMISMSIDIFNYNGSPEKGKSITIKVGGYCNTSGWSDVFAHSIGKNLNNFYNVSFGDNGTNSCIWIGDVTSDWRQPRVTVTDFIAHYSTSTFAEWADEWSIDIVSTLGTVSQSIESGLTVSLAFDSHLLNGSPSSQLLSNNTIVRRSSSGHIYANHLNTTASTHKGQVGALAVKNISDNYIRWQTPSAFISYNDISLVHQHPFLSNTGGVLYSGVWSFDTVLTIKSNDAAKSILNLYGDSQGSAYIHVGQSSSSGGGIGYSGDGYPTHGDIDASVSDKIVFFRTVSNNPIWTAYYSGSSNHWYFRNNIYTVADTFEFGKTSSEGKIYINSDDHFGIGIPFMDSDSRLTIGGNVRAYGDVKAEGFKFDLATNEPVLRYIGEGQSLQAPDGVAWSGPGLFLYDRYLIGMVYVWGWSPLHTNVGNNRILPYHPY